jgi:hypothetical protein
MVRKQANNIISGKQESGLRPSLFNFDDDNDILPADDDEEATLAALMEADAVDQGAPQTRASRMRREMQALERWLVENEELHEKEFGGADGVDDDDDGDEDHDGSGGDARPPPSVQVSVSAAPGVHAAPADDPWAASTPSNANPTSTSSTQTPTQSTALASHSISITTPQSSGFDDDFSVFVSAPAAPAVVSIAGDTTATAAKTITTPASTTASPSEPIADARRLHTQTQLLLPSHTGGSIRSIRSAMSDLSISDTGDDLGVGSGYEALDDISNDSLNFSPERGNVDIDDGDPRPSTSGQQSGDRATGLGDGPFNLPNILNALQTIREDVAGIEDEAERRATTARFASEFVYKRMGVDDGDGKETDG